MTCMASLYEILFYSELMSKGTKFWILVHFYVYNLIFTTWEFFCMYFSAKWYWWLKGLIPRIQKMHRGQIDLASMYEKKSVGKNESISPKWTQMDWMDSSMQYIIKAIGGGPDPFWHFLICFSPEFTESTRFDLMSKFQVVFELSRSTFSVFAPFGP